jgi:MgtC family
MNGIDLLVRVGLAVLLGVGIGIERQWRSRLTGLQTMALVSMGASLFVVLGAYSFHPNSNPAQVAGSIATGIGFLGGGVIMKQGVSVTGLNTAATLWATGAIGAAGRGVDVARSGYRGRDRHRRERFLPPAGQKDGSGALRFFARRIARRLRDRSGVSHGSGRPGARTSA